MDYTPLTPMNDARDLYKAVKNRIGYRHHQDEQYKSWVRQRNCVGCGKPGPGDPHHIFGSTGPMKSSDYFLVSCCRNCHIHYENNPKENTWLLVDALVGLLTYMEEER